MPPIVSLSVRSLGGQNLVTSEPKTKRVMRPGDEEETKSQRSTERRTPPVDRVSSKQVKERRKKEQIADPDGLRAKAERNAKRL